MTMFRPARKADLPQVHRIFYENEMRGVLDPPPFNEDAPDLLHLFQTGTMFVAEQDGQLLAYGAAITRGRITYLTDLFVHPAHQSSHLGKTILQHVLPPDPQHIRCTLSSTDPRAQSLYIRSGLQPQWPQFNLLWESPERGDLPDTDVEIVEASAADPAFTRWDARVSGRERPADHAFWTQQQRAALLWFRRPGKTVGYGYIRLGASSLWRPEMCFIGPLGVEKPEDATACVLAAAAWAQQRANVVRIDVPGPHPCLAPLLSARFRIVYVETFVSEAATPFFYARCYIPSGANLL